MRFGGVEGEKTDVIKEPAKVVLGRG